MRSNRRNVRLVFLRALATLPLRSTPVVKRTGEPPRILLIRPDHIGDLLFVTPALRLLRTAWPEAHLVAMVGPWGRAVIENNPNVDEILVCEFPGFTRKLKSSFLAPYRLAQQWATQLRSRQFDMALILRFDHWWGALLAHGAGIPQRLGYDIPECRPFLSQAIPYESHRHEVEQNLTLVRTVIGTMGLSTAQDPLPLEFPLREQDHEYVARYLARRGVLAPATGGEHLIAIHPGAGAPVKQWLPESWAQVGDALAASGPARIVITGSREELDLAWSVSARMRSEAIVAAGDTSLAQLAALFARCRLVIGPDCGPLHLAVAAGTPTVHLYGPVDPVKFGPWGAPDEHLAIASNRPCIPCNHLDYSPEELADHPCVREISVPSVLQAARKLLP